MQTEKICTGCGRSSLNPIGEQHIACCPDNNYIEMSNNKQSMKLYTEEQIRRTFGFEMHEIEFKSFMNAITPIELPSDEEIEKESEWLDNPLERLNFKSGIKWMRDKIQGGNK